MQLIANKLTRGCMMGYKSYTVSEDQVHTVYRFRILATSLKAARGHYNKYLVGAKATSVDIRVSTRDDITTIGLK